MGTLHQRATKRFPVHKPLTNFVNQLGHELHANSLGLNGRRQSLESVGPRLRQGNSPMIFLQLVFVALASLYGLSLIFTIVRDRQI